MYIQRIYPEQNSPSLQVCQMLYPPVSTFSWHQRIKGNHVLRVVKPIKHYIELGSLKDVSIITLKDANYFLLYITTRYVIFSVNHRIREPSNTVITSLSHSASY